MKLLVIRFSSIGDIVLTTPILRCIKNSLPGAEVHYLTKMAYKPVLEANPYIDKLHFLHDDLGKTIDELRPEKFDTIIDLHKNVRTLKVKSALNTKAYSFDKLNIQKWLLVNMRVDLMPDKSIVERYFEAIDELGVRNDGQGLDYFVPEERITEKDIPMSHWAGFVACVIGGSYNTKKLPISQWQKLIGELPYPVMLLGGPEDRPDGEAIAGLDNVKIYNACGKFSLNESALLVERAKVVVTNDTGLMHVAAAYKKPIISVWGNTSPEMGMFPYYGSNNLKKVVDPRATLVEHQHLGCHPCSKLGYARCPKGHFRCMNDLDMNIVSTMVKNYWHIAQR
jgi:ADP-heptose:LPS heptosyltransferase